MMNKAEQTSCFLMKREREYDSECEHSVVSGWELGRAQLETAILDESDDSNWAGKSSVGKGAASDPLNHMAGAGNWLLQVVHWPPHAHCGMHVCAHRHTW